MKTPFLRNIALVVCFSTGIGVAVWAQETRAPDDSLVHDALLAEIRTLRTEINQFASASIRMQLFVARLQLQEQRVLMAGRQLAEEQNALADLRNVNEGERARVEQLERSLSRATAQGQIQLQQAIVEAKAQIEQQERRQQELQQRERELLNTLNSEQARWTEFSGRLDVLERSLPTGGSVGAP